MPAVATRMEPAGMRDRRCLSIVDGGIFQEFLEAWVLAVLRPAYPATR
jgi:hypothetical protein